MRFKEKCFLLSSGKQILPLKRGGEVFLHVHFVLKQYLTTTFLVLIGWL